MDSIQKINQDIIACQRCTRLSEYINDVAQKKVKRFSNENYWGKAVPGFGDENARLLILGLAPAAHGANRTGRMFTGDSSGDWLYKALYETGFANQPTSVNAQDGLLLKDAYITATNHCAPPQNKPTPTEINNCKPFFERELSALSNLEMVLCLGNIAFTHFCRVRDIRGLKFAHNAFYELSDGLTLVSSYHPSRQNTQTGKLLWPDWLAVFQGIRSRLS